ncbi:MULTISPECIES: Fe-S cluster assembly sulfur transfer protein SufU [Rothia]|uniref:SUF system NifU family Fe-S cluster assembly protein n=1 Tax=Rothia mucilaginosa TaxID=43675 RepID=A0A930L0H6_9MICC|nr:MULTISPECIES: SUF system NifU family Fe-S cluster assembly protein [Rothia]MBF1641593.1 SUF system NifU family Fe-S cluster assembly protein [Rothia mucilaginosa]MBF1655561.1 SUF system NifU family Fe-S cluster assembly protein [Rothia sp. (in: high G+C Gram-positive bacteria)]MBF1659215.1 SUF system NifU family Fe-S cluster assembly protein [Rothia mucilaginosa]MBF1680498.1 SUF system NifU family Fe-S cluster assembly protein [Rothia sp. (in: high G+C Gram-positive bacteria)]OFJ76565.1 iro
MSLESLYQEIILEHSKQRSGEHLVEVPAGHASADNHQYNPTCGDEINLRVVLSDELKDGEKTIESISWEGDGCSISMAAASVLSEMAPGMTISELQSHVDAFREMLRSRGKVTLDEEEYGDMAAFSGVSKFMARVKCAMLSWVAVEEATKEAAAKN